MDSSSTIRRGIDEAVACGADAAGLQAVVEEATATARDDRARFRLALVYQALVAGLAIVGMLWTIQTNDRLIWGIEDSFLEPPIPPEHTIWSRITPTDLALAALGLLDAGGLSAWIVRLGHHDNGYATAGARCDLLAELAGCDCPPPNRDRIVHQIVAGFDPTAADAPPPLVAFAESRPDMDQLASLLRTTGAFYHSLADHRRRRMRRLVPIVGSLIAGIAVLGYGLALFHPLARLFDSLAVAHDPIGYHAPIGREERP